MMTEPGYRCRSIFFEKSNDLFLLLDQTDYRKSVSQLLALLSILGCEVDLVVKQKRSTTHAGARPEISGI
jgi:hypothetical protein